MNFLTHMAMSNILYDNLNGTMDLDKKAFVYGNIKPDLTSKLLQIPHTLENYIFFVCNSAEKLMNGDSNAKEFSLELGEICHYVCDFFCKYHIDDNIFHKFKSHFFYELRLHFVLIKNSSKIKTRPEIKPLKKNISSIIKELRKEYESSPDSMEKDLEFALKAATWVCEYVYYFSFNRAIDFPYQNKEASAQTIIITGGQ